MEIKIKDIGMLLLGVGIVMLGVSSLLFYKTFIKDTMPYNELNYYCLGDYIKIQANKDVASIKILYNNTIVCEFQDLKKGSSRICDISKYDDGKSTSIHFIIRYDNNEDIVMCFYYDRMDKRKIEPV